MPEIVLPTAVLSQLMKKAAVYFDAFYINALLENFTRAVFTLIISVLLYIWHLYGNCCLYDDRTGKKLPGPLQSCYFSKSPLLKIKQARKEKRISKCFAEYVFPELGDGQVCGIRLLGGKTVLTRNPEMFKTILTGHHEKFPKASRYSRLEVFLKSGLVTSSGSKWQLHRRIANKGFAAERFDTMVSVFITKAEEWSSRQHSKALASPGELAVVDFDSEMSLLTSSIICETAFSFDLDSKRSELEKTGQSTPFGDVQLLLNELNNRLLYPTDWWYKLYPAHNMKINAETSKTDKFLDELIRARISSRQKRPKEERNAQPRDLLDLLLDACESFTEEGNSSKATMTPQDLRDHLLTFLAAGHETTATTCMWLFYELCMHPEMQRRVQAEIDGALLSRKQAVVTITDLTKHRFPYLDACIKETMRLHPAATNIGRVTRDGCTLHYGKEFAHKEPLHLAAGTNIIMSIACLHRNPAYWEAPDEFDPERFLEPRLKSTIKHNFQFIPFSAGPRNCIGQRFASLELLAISTSVLGKLSLSISDEHKAGVVFEETIVQVPKNLRITVRARR